MKKNSKTRAFTLVVIAVFATLAALAIPALNILGKANASSALCDARNSLTAYLAENNGDGKMPETIVIFVEKADDVYVYGYSTSQDKLSSSKGNPFKGYAGNISGLIEAHNGTNDTDADSLFYIYPANVQAVRDTDLSENESEINTSAANEARKLMKYVKIDSKVCNAEFPEGTLVFHGKLFDTNVGIGTTNGK